MEAVAGECALGRDEEPDPVVVVQDAHGLSGDPGDLADGAARGLPSALAGGFGPVPGAVVTKLGPDVASGSSGARMPPVVAGVGVGVPT
ncbi:hypothetical protein GCM10007079_19350 [Nocardiopsis terrae]|nr:hypothetical protein GCM10007079_19350 [Nocardiopsis terrae]